MKRIIATAFVAILIGLIHSTVLCQTFNSPSALQPLDSSITGLWRLTVESQSRTPNIDTLVVRDDSIISENNQNGVHILHDLGSYTATNVPMSFDSLLLPGYDAIGLVTGTQFSLYSLSGSRDTICEYDSGDHQNFFFVRIGTTNGVARSAVKRSFSIFPNPATNWVVIQDDRKEGVTISDVLGRTVLIARSNQRISIAGLLPGTYSVHVGTEQCRFIVIH